MEETVLPSIAALTPEVRGRWRQERNSILDQLEAEERREQVREQNRDFEHKEVSEPHGIQLSEDEKCIKAPRQKKAVAFAEPDDDKYTLSSPSMDWGDVALGRLRPKGPTLMASQQPMKDVVVERVPTAPLQTDHPPDSDDESDYADHEQINEVHGIDDEENNSNMDDDSVSEEFEEEEYDLDSARHHREIALEYYAKRDKIGEAARAAMSSHSHVKDRDVELVRAISLHDKSVFDFSMSRIPTCRRPLNTSPLCLNLKLAVLHRPITLPQILLVFRLSLQLLPGKYRRKFELVD